MFIPIGVAAAEIISILATLQKKGQYGCHIKKEMYKFNWGCRDKKRQTNEGGKGERRKRERVELHQQSN